MLQVDPSQKKMVAVLVVALVGAVAFLVVRLVPRDQPVQAAAQAAQASPASQRVRAVGDTQVDSARNPFQRPAGVDPAMRRIDASDPGPDGTPGVRISLHDRSELAGGLDLRPMPVPALDGGGKPGSDAAKKPSAPKNDDKPAAQEKTERPSIKLLATVKSGGVYSAVLRVGDSQTRVVEVGDTVDGRYKVARLQDNMAVLVHGREVIIATRPRS